jgi:omega-amidase
MSKLTVAISQIDLVLGKPQKNLETIQTDIVHAKLHHADVIVLPELWSSAYDLENAGTLASKLGDGMFAIIAQQAREHQIAIVGSLLESDGGKVYNTSTFIDANGNRLGTYRKLHLVPMLDEPRFLTGGDDAPVFDAPFGKFALAVCYDLRFPELWRHYALSGAQIVFLSAEWPTKRITHWRTLVPARAIENQIFIAATNRVGKSKDERFGGHSMVVNPWGEAVAQAASRADLLVAEIDLAEVSSVRERVPVFKDRRADVYDKWSRQ